MALIETGYITEEELKASYQYPTKERFNKGPVAIIECIQEIPCNPCEAACVKEAIIVGEPITKKPILDDEKCSGCGLCVAQCPGLAIFIIDKTYSDTMATVAFPYEYTPLPEKGVKVEAVNREGEVVSEGNVVRIQNPKAFDKTPVVTVAVPKDKVEVVRSIKRLK